MNQVQLKRQRFLIKEHKAAKESQNIKMQPTRNYDEYLAKQILEDIRNRKSIDSIKTYYLNKLEIIGLPNIYPLFNNFLDLSIKEDLLQIILLSRLSKDIDLACSNAATILAKSDFSFKDLNLRNIRIPKADLSQCLLINVNFENSYLKEVQFLQSHLINVNFKNCDLSNVKFGVFMKIDLQDAIGLSFSPDDKNFYYRAGENIMEMNLKSQQSKIKESLNSFISTNITYIYYTENKNYRANVHGQYMEIYKQDVTIPVFTINTAKVVFSPNWKFIAALDSKSSVLCWNIEKNKQTIGHIKICHYKGSQLVFSPCSRYLGIIKTTRIRIIETENWTLVRTIYGKFSVKKAFAFSYDGKKIAYSDTLLLQLIDTETSDKTRIYINNKKVRGLSFSPCGRFLAFGANENTGYIIELASQRISHIFLGFENNALSVLFSPSNKYIAWTDSNSNIRVFEFYPNFLKNDYNRHYQIQAARISPKGTYLITLSLEKIILWDLTIFSQIKILAYHSFYAGFVFSPFETYLAWGITGGVNIYDIKRDYFILCKWEKYRWSYFSFSENEDHIISLNGSTYEYYKLPSFELVKSFSIPVSNLYTSKYSSCGKYHLFKELKKLYIWDLDKNEVVKIWHINSFFEFNFASLLKQIAYVDSHEICIRVSTINKNENTLLNSKGEIPVCHCFSSDEKFIIGGYKNGIINIWNVKTQTVFKKIRSLALRDIKWIESINNLIYIREKDNIEIFKLDKLIE